MVSDTQQLFLLPGAGVPLRVLHDRIVGELVGKPLPGFQRLIQGRRATQIVLVDLDFFDGVGGTKRVVDVKPAEARVQGARLDIESVTGTEFQLVSLEVE